MEKDKVPKTANPDPRNAVSMTDAGQTSRVHASPSATEHGSGQEDQEASSSRDLEAAMPAGSSTHERSGELKDKAATQQVLTEVKVHGEASGDDSIRGTTHGDDKQHSSVETEARRTSKSTSADLMEKEKLSVGESRFNSDSTDGSSESLGLRRRRSSRLDSQKATSHEGGSKTPEDERTQGPTSARGNVPALSGPDIKQKSAERKGAKQVKAKGTQAEKESSSLAGVKVAGKKGVEPPSLEDLRDMESDRKVQESLDTFIRQTMGREPYMSFTSRPGDKPLQRILENQQAASNKYAKSLQVDVDMRDGPEDNTSLDPHQAEMERDSSVTGTKGGGSLGRGLQGDRSLPGSKNSVPQAVAALAAAAAKNTDLPGWPLLSPSKVQLQKCDKCSREFCSPFNHRRHIRTHRRLSYVDKDDLFMKRKNVAAFWDKLNTEEALQIVGSSKNFDLEDLSGESAVSNLIAFMGQNSSTPLPPAYLKAGQDLLDMLDSKRGVRPLSAEQLLSILDEASERTFLCGEQKYVSQGDVSKIGLEEKNLVASLGFIVEQTLVKAWMADKDAEALRNQQELVKEEEAAQMKREKNVAKKKKKKEKIRQKISKERKPGASQLALNEENESVDDENPSPEIVEEDNSPTASSASGSYGHDNTEALEVEISDQPQQVEAGTLDDDRGQQSGVELVSNDGEGEQLSVVPFPSQAKLDESGGGGHKTEQDQSTADFRKRAPARPFKEQPRVDYQDPYGYQRGGWDVRSSDSRFPEGPQQSSYKPSRKPLTGIPYSPRSESGSSPVPGFYRGKAPVRGPAPFQATQQWAKKTQPPPAVDNVKDGQEDENPRTDDSSAIKNNPKELAAEPAVVGREPDADSVVSTSRPDKEEIKIIEKKEPFPAPVTSAAKVVASTGGLGSVSTGSFNLDVNSVDWPPLSGSYTKSAGASAVEGDAKALNKADNEKSRAKGEGSNSKPQSSMDDNIFFVGLFEVPLGDYVDPSRPGLGAAGSRSSPFSSSQSYTAVLAAPPVRQPARDPIPATASRQRVEEATSNPETGGSLDVQTGDAYGGPSHYRGNPSRPPTTMNSNLKQTRAPVYSAGDRGERGVPTKQPSWSSGPARYPPQKVWRPVRSTGESADPILGGGTGNESNPTSGDERGTAEFVGIEESASNLTPAEDLQVGEADSSAMPRSVDGTCDDVADRSSDHAPSRKEGGDDWTPQTVEPDQSQDATSGDSKVADSKVAEYQEETSQAAPVSRDDTEKANLPVRDNSEEEEDVRDIPDKKDDVERTDQEPIMESAPTHSAWIAEAVQYHSSRWNSALADPETVIHKDDEERVELQTTKWVEFMTTLPCISRQSIPGRKDTDDPSKAPDAADQTGGKAPSSTADEQRMDAQYGGQESRLGPQGDSTEGGPLRDTSPGGSEHSLSGGDTGAGSITGGGAALGPQAPERRDREGRVGSRSGSNSSSSSSTGSRQERRTRTGTVSTAGEERLPEQRYMPRRSRPEEKD